MIAWLFNLVYGVALLAWSPVLLWEYCRGKRRSQWRQRLWGPDLVVPHSDANSTLPLVWLHAVSVGEVNLLVTLLPALRQKYSGYRFAISASTDTGLALARRRFPDDLVFRFPIDFSWAGRRIVRQLNPEILILTELEIWPNILMRLLKSQVPVVVVNGRLSDKSFRRYRYVPWLLRAVWQRLTLVLVQSDEYQKRFIALGVPAARCHVVGSIKFDAVIVDRANSRTTDLRNWAGLGQDELVWLAGSTSAPEEQIVLDAFGRLRGEFPHLRLIVVPRHQERFEEVAAMCRSKNWAFRRRSVPETTPGEPWEVLLVDTIGELADWWGTADIGFVGGSMGSRGGQSMIEPAGYGVAIAFGPNTSNFRDVVGLLLDEQAAVVVRNTDELTDFVAKNCRDETYRKSLGSSAQQVARAQTGATAKTLSFLELVFDREA